MATREEVLSSAQQEMQAFHDMYMRMQEQCWNKCVPRYSEAELTQGEAQCADYCVRKYMDVHQRVGKILHGLQQQQQQQQQQQRASQ